LRRNQAPSPIEPPPRSVSRGSGEAVCGIPFADDPAFWSDEFAEAAPLCFFVVVVCDVVVWSVLVLLEGFALWSAPLDPVVLVAAAPDWSVLEPVVPVAAAPDWSLLGVEVVPALPEGVVLWLAPVAPLPAVLPLLWSVVLLGVVLVPVFDELLPAPVPVWARAMAPEITRIPNSVSVLFIYLPREFFLDIAPVFDHSTKLRSTDVMGTRDREETCQRTPELD
jgi:hypothetical protein